MSDTCVQCASVGLAVWMSTPRQISALENSVQGGWQKLSSLVSDQRMPISNSISTALALLDHASAEVKDFPTWLQFLAPRRARRRKIVDHLLGRALSDLSSLTEGDVAYLVNFLAEEEATWLKKEYVNCRSEEIADLLKNSRQFSGSSGKKSDPSFDANIYAGLIGVSVHDKPILDMYAQIRAGERVRPGTFSKRTCNLVRDLDSDVIGALEFVAPYVVSGSFPVNMFQIFDDIDDEEESAITDDSDDGGDDNVDMEFDPGEEYYDRLLLLEEYSLLSLSHSVIHFAPGEKIELAGGRSVLWDKSGELSLECFPFTSSGSELLRLHDVAPAPHLIQWIIKRIPESLHPQIIDGAQSSPATEAS